MASKKDVVCYHCKQRFTLEGFSHHANHPCRKWKAAIDKGYKKKK